MSEASDPLLEALRKKIRTEMNEITDHIAVGGCDTFEDYKFNVGKINGLAVAERELLDIDQKVASE